MRRTIFRALLLIGFFPLWAFSQQKTDTSFNEFKENNGFLAFEVETRWGFLTTNGTQIPAIYEEVGSFNDGVCPVKKDEKWGVIDKNGKVVVPFRYKVIYAFRNYRSIAISEKGAQLIESKGNFISKCFTAIDFDKFPYYIVQEDKNGLRQFIINQKNESRFPKNKFWAVSLFVNHEEIAGKHGKYGIINEKGKRVIPFKYEDIAYFQENLAAVKKQGKFGFINRKNKLVIPFEFDRIERGFHQHRAIVGQGKPMNYKYSLIDEKGVKLSSFKYTIIQEVAQNPLIYRVMFLEPSTKNSDWLTHRWGLIDENAREIVPPKYNSIYLLNDKEACAQIDGNYQKVLLNW